MSKAVIKAKKINLVNLTSGLTPVEISIGEIDVRKLRLDEIGEIFTRFPRISSILNGGTASLTIDDLIREIPEAIPFVISKATDNGDDGIEGAKNLNILDQAKLIGVIFEKTLPGGLAGFFDEMNRTLLAQGMTMKMKEGS